MFEVLNSTLEFPDPKLADSDGLLAVGGELSVERLLHAYRSGIFPWFQSAGIIYWFCPPERLVLFPSQIRVSRSTKRIIRSNKFSVTVNTAFEELINSCANYHLDTKGETWIDDDFITAYVKMHERGYAHSIEVWHQDNLVGGLYGIVIGKMFCGESMFSIMPDASKIALIHLCNSDNYSIIDCQVPTAHLIGMGAQIIEREKFLELIKRYLDT